MRIKGALHVHSTLSHDGTMTIPALATWYKNHSYQFIAMGEHSQDLSEEKVEVLKTLCDENSDTQFCILPGIEYSCRGDIHIFAPGMTRLILEDDPVFVSNEIHRQGGFAILAHPKSLKWDCPKDLLLALNAVELWNVGYDGKFLPSRRAPLEFCKMKDVNPQLLAVAGHDLHKSSGYYDVAVQMEVDNPSPPVVLETLRMGKFQIQSRFFATDSGAHLSWGKSAVFQLMGWHLEMARRARGLLLSEPT